MNSISSGDAVADASPMTDLTFNILVTLTDEELHGYALIKRLRELEGRASLRTGTVYAALARLREDGWVEEVDDPDSAEEDSRRRVYRVTDRGREAARIEAVRLREALERARTKRLVGEGARG